MEQNERGKSESSLETHCVLMTHCLETSTNNALPYYLPSTQGLSLSLFLSLFFSGKRGMKCFCWPAEIRSGDLLTICHPLRLADFHYSYSLRVALERRSTFLLIRASVSPETFRFPRVGASKLRVQSNSRLNRAGREAFDILRDGHRCKLMRRCLELSNLFKIISVVQNIMKNCAI